MDIIIFKGMLAGLILGMPVGPLGAIAIRKMLTKGSLHGLFFGFGCALVDIIYGIIIGLGVNFISDFITPNQYWISLLGGIFLIAFGIKVYFTVPILNINTDGNRKDYINSFLFSFFLALTNPTTLLSFSVVFASLNLGVASLKSFSAFQLITGIVLGGACWWVILSLAIKYLQRNLTQQSLKYINKLFGILIIFLVVLMYIFK